MSNIISDQESHAITSKAKYKGVRQRKWGKWVSEIRVPGSQERLWLGTYKTPEGAAVAHDIAYYCLRGSSCMNKLNFPMLLPNGAQAATSPGSIQKAATDAGMAIDAQLIGNIMTDQNYSSTGTGMSSAELGSNGGGFQGANDDHVYEGEALNISVEDYL